MSAPEFDEEDIRLSRERLAIPDDWQWFPCATGCGDIVWSPPEFGDVPKLEMVCSTRCAQRLMVLGPR